MSPTISNRFAMPMRYGQAPRKIIGQGDTLPLTPVKVQHGILHLMKKDQSSANLSRDIWMVEDTQTGQKYSLFSQDMNTLYAQCAQLGEGAQVQVEGTAHKPMPQQRYPFLTVRSFQAAP